MLGEQDNLFLVGFMGCGKSSVAGRIAGIMQCRVLDMDEVIENRAGMAISKIFEKYGEDGFREMETQTLRDIAPSHAVISCGGGVCLREENRRLMREKGKVVYLTVEPETVLRRLQVDQTKRPVLKGNMNIEYISGLINARDPLYRECADYTIRTDGRSLDEICRDIARQVMNPSGGR